MSGVAILSGPWTAASIMLRYRAWVSLTNVSYYIFFLTFDKQNLLNIMTIDIKWYLLVVFDSIQIMS